MSIDVEFPLEHTDNSKLIMYVVHKINDHTKANYAMRKVYIGEGIIKWYGWQEFYTDFDKLHKRMIKNGFIPFSRSPGDAPNIICTYI